MTTYEEGNVESGNERNAGQEETNVTANNTELSLEWQLIQSVSLYLPTPAEADMRKTDAAPHKEVGKTRERQEPGEKVGTSVGFINKGEETENELNNDTPDRATFAINVHDKLGPHTPRRKCLHGACRAEGTGVCHTENGYGNDGVEDRGETAHTSHLDCEHKGRSLGVGAG